MTYIYYTTVITKQLLYEAQVLNPDTKLCSNIKKSLISKYAKLYFYTNKIALLCNFRKKYPIVTFNNFASVLQKLLGKILDPIKK